jgi:hypothetical protein
MTALEQRIEIAKQDFAAYPDLHSVVCVSLDGSHYHTSPEELDIFWQKGDKIVFRTDETV